MTMVASGIIRLGDSGTVGSLNQSVNIELGAAATATITMNDAAARTLAAVGGSGVSYSMSAFYGKSSFTSALHVYTTAGSATETTPAGCHNVTIEVWAGGEAGANANLVGASGGGGGSAGYSRSYYACTGGQTINYTVGSPGANGGLSGTNSTATSGTLAITTMTSTSGTGATIPTGGTGGTASGGNQANTAGNNGAASDGTNGDPGGVGGANVAGVNYAGAGGGGSGATSGIANGHPGNPGGVGAVVFSYT